jgi:hypothetical protein
LVAADAAYFDYCLTNRGGLKKTGSSRMQPVSNKLDRFFIPLNDRFMNQSEKILRTARLTLG